MLECVPNISEGRDDTAIGAFAGSCGDALLDVHRDADHHRSVFTLASPDTGVTIAAVRSLALEVARRSDLSSHEGVHPRLGALDVVPFVAWGAGGTGADTEEAVEAAHDFAAWITDALALPVFLYGFADAQARTLPQLRRDAFVERAPDVGPTDPHPTLGAVAVGVRPIMIAVNVELASGDLELARAVATTVRERDGGLPGVRALGFALESRGHAQVSMNLVDLTTTGLEEACNTVRREIEAAGSHVDRVELVGLIPASEFERTSDQFRQWSGITASDTLEARLTTSG